MLFHDSTDRLLADSVLSCESIVAEVHSGFVTHWIMSTTHAELVCHFAGLSGDGITARVLGDLSGAFAMGLLDQNQPV